MRLLSLDFDPTYGDDNERSEFKGDLSVFDFDVVMWDPAGSLSSYTNYYQSTYKGVPSLGDDESVRAQADIERRRSEFLEFVNAGRTLIVIGRPPQECYVATGRKKYSGTGKNRISTRLVAPIDLLDALPLDVDPQFEVARGNRIDVSGDGPIASVLRKYREFMTYETVISGFPGAALARVTGTDRMIAGIHRFGNAGHLIILPSPDFQLKPEDDEDVELEVEVDSDEVERWTEEAPEFQTDLLAAVEQLGSAVSSRPAWTERFSTAEQQRIRTELVEQFRQVEVARTKLSALQGRREEAESRDQLYLGTGRALELEVKAVFEVLGGTVTEPPPGRDDWRVAFAEGQAVVEVKGLTKSAAEKHAAQLEKWVAGLLEGTGEQFKGILVVNTYRETPLDKRTKKSFPDQMVPYSTSRSHCLVTGLQLFLIRSEVENDPARAEHWRKQLLESSGIIEGADDWQSVIETTQPEVS